MMQIVKFQMLFVIGIACVLLQSGCSNLAAKSPRERISINNDWRFTKDDPAPAENTSLTENLDYPINPGRSGRGFRGANTQPAPEVDPTSGIAAFILPTGNDFISDPAKRYVRPGGNYGANVSYVSADFDDSGWRKLDLPHDFAIEGPFTTSGGGGMGRLPSAGVAWYRKHLNIPSEDSGKQIYLEIDGSMSYTTAWCNGQIAGGWPYGYSSWQVDLTPYIKFGSDNVLAIRLDNPPSSSRWYPGAGIYRNVWLTKTSPVHVAQWGTYVTTPEVSEESAKVSLKVTVDNNSKHNANVTLSTQIFEINSLDKKVGGAVAAIAPVDLLIKSGEKATTETNGTVKNPKLWGTGKYNKPNRYVAVTEVEQDGEVVDIYETIFGIRTLKFDGNAGFILNDKHIKINGVDNHHDLGALGAAFNYRAAERQLEILAEMGCNAIRTSHNPPAPELLELADKMGFLIMDEAFDVWERQKTPNDYHLVYARWHEQDLRAMLRRDRNHPSVIIWSVANEVGEQNSGAAGAALTKELVDICHEEDPTRPVTAAMNSAKPDNPMPAELDLISLNYQGEGIRYDGPYSELRGGNRTSPQFPAFHEKFPEKVVLSSENAAALSTRGTYIFPVY
jgi:beta-galactosidase